VCFGTAVPAGNEKGGEGVRGTHASRLHRRKVFGRKSRRLRDPCGGAEGSATPTVTARGAGAGVGGPQDLEGLAGDAAVELVLAVVVEPVLHQDPPTVPHLVAPERRPVLALPLWGGARKDCAVGERSRGCRGASAFRLGCVGHGAYTYGMHYYLLSHTTFLKLIHLYRYTVCRITVTWL